MRIVTRSGAVPRTNFNFMTQAPVQTRKNDTVVAEGRCTFHDARGSPETSRRASGGAENTKGRIKRPCGLTDFAMRSALACLEARIALADHENLAATAHDLAVAMPLLRGLE